MEKLYLSILFSCLILAGANAQESLQSVTNNGNTTYNAMRVTGDNNLNGGDAVEIYRASSGVGSLFSYNRTTSTYLPLDFGASTFNFRITGATAMFLNNNGRLGLGTTTPNARLEADGAVIVSGNSANLDGAIAGNDLNHLASSGKMIIGWNRSRGDGETDFISNQGAGGSGGFSFYNHNNQNEENHLLRIKGDGKVGVGVSSPSEMLEVGAGASASAIKVGNTSGGFVKIGISDNNTSVAKIDFTNSLLLNGGNVAIGTSDTKGFKLAVAGPMVAESVKVQLQNSWVYPDYVFKPTYKLPSLQEVESFIAKNHHLPEIPSEREAKDNGLDLGEMNARLLKKIEELTLYMIDQNKQMKALQEEVSHLKETNRIRKEKGR